MEHEVSDRNEWFKDVKRLIRGLEVETVEDPFACPTVKSVTDGEDVLHALGLHPSRDVCGRGRNAALEHGKFVFVEVKSCMADFKSGHGLTFLGDENWLVCPRDLAHELYDERLLPFGVQVYCPDNGGDLRLTYDLRMQAAKSLREDSTLCLLWAMLMDSYSRWRTTWDVFNETGESYDL